MKTNVFNLTLAIATICLMLVAGCEKDDNPLTPEPNAPKGLSACKAWIAFQLSTGGNNGDLYSIWSNSDTKLNRQGMITEAEGCWNLTYSHVWGKEYKGSNPGWDKGTHQDNYGTYTPLNQILNFDSYEAMRVADANGGSAYAEVWSMTVASGNGNVFGQPGETFWVIIYKIIDKDKDDARRLFLINARTGIFFKRINFLS